MGDREKGIVMQAHKANRVHIAHIKIGFADIVANKNYPDSHSPLDPFGMKWGRGILIRGKGYRDVIIGSYTTSHSALKNELKENESSEGTFYFGYAIAEKTLYLEYASDRMFDFHDRAVIDAIMKGLKEGAEPFNDFILDVKTALPVIEKN